MGLPASQYPDARCRPQPGGTDDRGAAPQGLRPYWSHAQRYLLAALLLTGTAQADSYRIATYSAPLSRDGPGLLLRDIQRGADPQIAAIADIVGHIAPDVLVLTDFDYDRDNMALRSFAELFDPAYPHIFALRPNAGLATGLDLDADGRLGDARDAQGYGRFAGDGGLAILSRLPPSADQVNDLSDMLWKDLPGATLPQVNGVSFLTTDAQNILRLSSTGHWVVPIMPPDAPPFSLMVYAATPPVFDGPEDMNGLRNRDELRLWEGVLAGTYGPVPDSFVIAGNANLDPNGGAGFSSAMAAFLQNPQLQDPLPDQPTADWPEDGPGDLRVNYVLPSADWTVTDAGVFWPAPEDPDRALLGDDGLAAGVHRLVWVDIAR